MESLVFFLIAFYLFAPVCAIILLVRTGRHAKRLHAAEEELERVKKEALRQDAHIAALRRALTEAGISAREEGGLVSAQSAPSHYTGEAPASSEPAAAEAAASRTAAETAVSETQEELQSPDTQTAVSASAEAARTAGEPEPPEKPAAPPQAPDAQIPQPSPAGAAPTLAALLTRFAKGGNLWVAGGVLLLFAAFGFLLSYIARRGFFTIEMRIAAAIVAGIAMLVFGWRLRGRRPGYALVIQGGGIGVLYLSFFAASKLTTLLPAPAALALVSLLIPSTITLAILQNSQTLAVFGLLGGFAAPILLSSGSGNYIALFSYYTILDLAVVVIARCRLWRVLNMMAGLSTFITALAWIADRYEPEMFATAEPFMLGFILIFTYLGIYSAQSAKISLKNYVDLPLTLGTPFLGALTQWRIFSYIDHGLAIVCVAFSALYLFLTRLIWKKTGAGIRGLAEGYLGLSVLLANLAIPLELSPRLTSAVWAAEAAVLFVLGCRLESKRLRITSLVFHAACAAAFFVELRAYGGIFYEELPAFRNPVFTGGLLISVSALVCAVFASRASAKTPAGLPPRLFTLSGLFGVWGLLWWLASWGAEFFRLPGYSLAEFFILTSFTAIPAYGAGKRFGCPSLYLGLAAPLLLAVYLVCSRIILRATFYFVEYPLDVLTINFFDGMFLWGWLFFFATQAFFLWRVRAGLSPPPHAFWLALVLFIAVTVLTCTGRAYTQLLELARSWRSFAGVLPSFICVTALSLGAQHWGGAPEAYRRAVFIQLPRILCAAVGIWFTGTLFSLGDPAPLPLYIPVLNPLELQQAFCIALILLRQFSLRRAGIQAAWKPQTLFIVADLMVFLWLMSMTLRASRWYMDLSFSEALSSGAFQLALLILWGVYGIGHILTGHRKGLRGLWLAGAVLTVIDIAKLFLVDLAKTGTITRIISFFVAGLLLLFIGWAAPLPPAHKENPGVKNE